MDKVPVKVRKVEIYNSLTCTASLHLPKPSFKSSCTEITEYNSLIIKKANQIHPMINFDTKENKILHKYSFNIPPAYKRRKKWKTGYGETK